MVVVLFFLWWWKSSFSGDRTTFIIDEEGIIEGIIEKVKTNNVPTIFCESTVSNEGQKEVAKTTGVQFGGNLYVDSLSNKDGPVPTYLDLLKYDTKIITEGLLNSEL